MKLFKCSEKELLTIEYAIYNIYKKTLNLNFVFYQGCRSFKYLLINILKIDFEQYYKK